MTQIASIILAAGQGTRMKSEYPKVLHEILGKPMLRYTIDAARKVGANPIIVVVGFQGEKVIDTIGDGPQYVWQKERLGTGHAVMTAREALKGLVGDLIVLYGDTPLLRPETIRDLVNLKKEQRAAAAVLTARLPEPFGYGRIVRDQAGNIRGIVEEKDAGPEEKSIDEINTGVYCFDIDILLAALDGLSPVNAQGEYYLTDVFKIMGDGGRKIVGLTVEDAFEVMGTNDRAQLAQAEKYLRNTINNKWMLNGVTIEDPDFTYIESEVEIGADSIILPGTFLSGKTKIGPKCIIGPHTRIIDSVIGSGTAAQFSQINGATIGAANNIGPFAFLRPGTVSEDNVKFGDFVEVKNSRIGGGSKVPHLSYLGDAEVGTEVNIGAGTITCNYDGFQKNRTVIKDRAFIGSNANLVAPVVIGADATVAAGSTITKEVPDNALGVARGRQELKLNWRPARRRLGK